MGKEAQLMDTQKRRLLVLEYRRQGGTYRQIADQVLREVGAERLPKGWDERYAYMDLKRELKRVRSEVAESAEEVLDLELKRLDEMLTRIYPVALGSEKVPPDPRAIDRVLRIMERRSKLMGLEGPKGTEDDPVHHEHKHNLGWADGPDDE